MDTSRTANSSNKNENTKSNLKRQMLLSLFEINVIRYSLFIENLKPEYIDPFFMIDFMSLPEDYFSGDALHKYGSRNICLK